MTDYKASLGRVGQWCFFIFMTASLIDTTNFLIITPLTSWTLVLLRSGIPARWPLGLPPRQVPSLSTSSVPAFFTWRSSQFTLDHGLGHTEPTELDSQTFLSKLLANSMRPSNVTPYFYRANGTFSLDDVTITTLITSDRFRVFARLVEKYKGPVSVTVHIGEDEDVPAMIQALERMYHTSVMMQMFVDMHLVIDSFDRQLNTWRNIARLFARTDYVMMLDIDFYPCTDFRRVAGVIPSLKQNFKRGDIALVVPAFEYSDYLEGTDYRAFPRNKDSLLHLVEQGRIGMFHASWGPGHSSSDYKRFYAATPGEVYRVTKYQPAYEPYVIIKKDGPPWCDERFVGYGGNKAACLFEMYLSGISYYVLADHFIIHQNHLYEEVIRKNERKINRKVYSDFKDEICLRYLKSYHDGGLLNNSLALNAITECRKIQSAARLAAEYL